MSSYHRIAAGLLLASIAAIQEKPIPSETPKPRSQPPDWRPSEPIKPVKKRRRSNRANKQDIRAERRAALSARQPQDGAK